MKSSKRSFQIDGGGWIKMAFWGNKKVLVTGGAGFLGSFIMEKLKEKGGKWKELKRWQRKMK